MLAQVQKLKEEERVATPSARAEIELRLREVQRSLEEHEKLVQQNQQLDPKARAEAEARLREVQQNLEEHRRLLQMYQQQEGSDSEQAREAQKRFAELLAKYQESTQMRDMRRSTWKLRSCWNSNTAPPIHRHASPESSAASSRSIPRMLVKRTSKAQSCSRWS